MTTCPKCGSQPTDSGQPSQRQFFACDSYGYKGNAELANQGDLCRAWSKLREVKQIVTTNAESKEQLLARIKSILE